MNANNLTGAQALQAREDIGLSVMSVSKITGINRNQISQFEQEKMVLSANDKGLLMRFYSERGYHFGDASKELKEHQVFKAEQLKEIKQEFGNQLAITLETILHDLEEKLEGAQIGIDDQGNDLDKGTPISKEYIQLEAELIKHFEADKEGKFINKCGFFSESDTARRSKLVSLMGLQYLRLLEIKYPEIVTLSQSACKEDTDNLRTLECIAECLDYVSLGEFKHITSDLLV